MRGKTRAYFLVALVLPLTLAGCAQGNSSRTDARAQLVQTSFASARSKDTLPSRFVELGASDVKASDLATIRTAARRGDAKALLELAIAYGYGIGVKVDVDRYLTYIGQAARHGQPQAEDTAGYLLLKSNPKGAVTWFSAAAAQGYSQAQFDLGTALLIGRGVSRNPAKACQYFALAASQGNADGEYSYGTCYYRGIGVRRDLDSAFKWYTKAANQSYPLAEAGLGVMYALGKPVQRNLVESLKWFLLAQSGPSNEVDLAKIAPIIAEVKQNMSPDEIQSAQSLAAQFQQTHPRFKRETRIDFNGNFHF